jgi:hypothetical protein
MPMDLNQTLQDLYEEKERIDNAIATLEALYRSFSGDAPLGEPARRGRKSMGSKERNAVSERMRRYWASRRERDKRDQKAG